MDDKIEKKISLNQNSESNGKDHVKEEVYRKVVAENLSESNKTQENTQENQQNGNSGKMVVHDENAINDGADEQMLGADDHKLTEKRDEVKFIKGGDHQNGDAKIDIGKIDNGKTFTGMTKEELMRFANDPFWVRLRWIFFILFWAVWLAMLVGAIYIILKAPKCSAPEPLPWYKRGPLAQFKNVEAFTDEDVAAVKHLEASGAIYELPPQLTYNVADPIVEEKIKNLVAKYKKDEINLILDITPNYVDGNSILMKEALADESKRSSFIWVKQHQVPNNWVSIKNGTAWTEIQPGNYVLSQFGDGLFDLHMNDTLVKKEFEASLKHLIELGVKGFRLKNTRYYLLSKNLQSEVIAADPRFSHTEYGFWTHTQTVFQDGLGKLLKEYSNFVKNSSSDAFVSVADDLLRPEVYQADNNTMSIELPIYGQFMQHVSQNQFNKLGNEINTIRNVMGNNTWVQYDFSELVKREDAERDISAITLFMSLMPGVPVIPMDTNMFKNISVATFKHINRLRHSPSYMHGDFRMYSSNEVVAYSRIKSGNPGYFVVYNPAMTVQPGNFTGVGLPDKMNVDAISDNYNVTGVSVKSKIQINSLVMSPHSTIILSYVPLKG